ncbi:dihydrofolate reductase-like domain-containing protein [Microdochium trichocladiopsis]|uniref:Dihydrofolate reductase n=1 Tax=Microdochium trichocladiopsis TaxID=1682393 RepID=A0A9P8YE94_9PEZI|nr:dihydrofolate reductase-like domain-containing protein [Microdochium trichocladiopsis]KAH7037850.1 dihydrofolate reductase-like domain-containing protein [Microdochium trichocladiopsis]
MSAVQDGPSSALSHQSSTAMPPPIELTLVVAATRQMGIGKAGTLPWTGLRKEMAYFARVTKRVPASSDPSTKTQNVLIMGRKTWDSIPPNFRPLKDRLNIVISRSHPDHHHHHDADSDDASETTAASVVKLSSLDAVLRYLQARQATTSFSSPAAVKEGQSGIQMGKVFVIGGGEIYAAALRLKEARRVLLTSVQNDFECDTFFPQISEETGWEKQSKEALDAWTGEDVPGGEQEENGTRYEFQMWERK